MTEKELQNYTEEEAKALLLVMGCRLKEHPKHVKEPDIYYLYGAYSDEIFNRGYSDGMWADTYKDLLQDVLRELDGTND